VKSHEIALIEKAVSGDVPAAAELYEAVKPRFEQLAEGFLREKGCCAPEQHCKDVAEAARVKIFSSLATLWSPYNFKGWSERIISNCCWDHLKQCWNEVSFNSLAQRTTDESGESEIEFDPPSPDPSFLGGRDAVVFSAVLINEILTRAAGPDYPPRFHDILKMQLSEDLDLRSVAGRLDMSYDNVRTIHSRGIRQLMRDLGVEKQKEMKKKLTRGKKEDKGDKEEPDSDS
jgi:DNA-directed RNA polymerase specialized sigma24 family protein